ncbi:MAG: TRAP transporter large permease subunit [Myxococcota bacterium]
MATDSTGEVEFEDALQELAPLERRLTQGVGIFVGILALVMVVLPVVQALARRFADTEIPAASVIVQHLTLWVGFLGALLAAGSGKHLSLSTAEAIPEGWPRRLAGLLTRMTSAAVAALLAYASWKVVQADESSGRTVVGSLPVSWSEAIMPITFGLISLRFAWRVGKGPQSWLDRGLAVLAIGGAFALGSLAPSSTVATVLLVAIGVSFLVGTPVFVVMGAAAMVLFWKDDTPIAAVPAETFRLVSSATLPAIPLLTIAGYVLAEGGAAKRLVRAYKGFFGWLPGGVAVMATVVCAVFTTFTGGSGVTILALGGLLLPMLTEEKYPEGFSHGLVTASGSLGLLFPPSLPVILYSVVASVPVAQLYLGGLVPGLLMMALVAAYGIFMGVKHHIPRQAFNGREALRGLWEAKWDLGLPLLVVLMVATGLGTIVEASALGCAYALVVEMAVFRTIHPIKVLPRVLVTATTLVGAVVILLGVAMGASSWLVDAEVPTTLLEWTTEHVKSPWVFLLALNVGLLVFGSVLEIYAAIVVLAPLVAPIGAAYGIDPVHLGIIFLANLELGFLFPPMGLNLFLSATRFRKPLPYLYLRTLPFLAILAVGVILITYVEVMTTGVVNLAK